MEPVTGGAGGVRRLRGVLPPVLLIASVVIAIGVLLPGSGEDAGPPPAVDGEDATPVEPPPASQGVDHPVLWTRSGPARESYELRYVTDLDLGAPVAIFSAAVPSPDDYGALVARESARPHRGRTTTFSAELRARDLTGFAGLWLRVDRCHPGPDCRGGAVETLTLEYSDRLTDDTSWNLVEVTGAVPEDADWIVFGILFEGDGEVAVHDPRVRSAGT